LYTSKQPDAAGRVLNEIERPFFEEYDTHQRCDAIGQWAGILRAARQASLQSVPATERH